MDKFVGTGYCTVPREYPGTVLYSTGYRYIVIRYKPSLEIGDGVEFFGFKVEQGYKGSRDFFEFICRNHSILSYQKKEKKKVLFFESISCYVTVHSCDYDRDLFRVFSRSNAKQAILSPPTSPDSIREQTDVTGSGRLVSRCLIDHGVPSCQLDSHSGHN